VARIVYSAQNIAEAQLVRDRLEQGGIPIKVSGESLVAISGGLPVPEATITISVERDEDLARARALIAEVEAPGAATGTWACPCGETNPASFQSCWQCGQQRSAYTSVSPAGSDDAAAAPGTSPAAGLPSATSLQFLVALVLGYAPLCLLVPWLEHHAGLAKLPLFRPDVALNLVYAGVLLVCLVVLRAMGLRIWATWGRSRYWPLHIALGLIVGWVAFWFEIFETMLVSWSPAAPPANSTDVLPPLPEWGALVAAVFMASICGRMLAYGAILPVLRRWLRSGATAYLATSLLLALLWSPTGGLRWLAILFGLELLFAAHFHVSKRAWAVALASTVTTVLPLLPHRS
jgi:hypothetical protein